MRDPGFTGAQVHFKPPSWRQQVFPLHPLPYSNADTLKRLHEAERVLKERNEAAYVDLDACNTEREAGNEAFKAMDFPKAVKVRL